MKASSTFRGLVGRLARSSVAVVAVTAIFAAKALTVDSKALDAGSVKNVTEIAHAPLAGSLR